MKKLFDKLIVIAEKLQEEIERREEIFYDRSEKWQDGEKGEIYSDKTAELEDVLNSVDEAKDNFELFLNLN